MNNTSSHKDYCENYNGNLTELAADIGAMTHQARFELFNALAEYVSGQYRSDLQRGRVKYAEVLKKTADALGVVAGLESDAWDICQSCTKVISKV